MKMEKNNKSKFKILFGYLIILFIMISVYSLDVKNSKKKNIDTKNETTNILESEEINTSDDNIESKTIENNDMKNNNDVISLDRGIELLNNDEIDSHVIINRISIDESIRMIKDVSFSGTYAGMSAGDIYLDNIVTKNKIYNDIPVPFENGCLKKEVDLTNLKTGDRVDVVCTIMEHRRDFYCGYSREPNDFVVFYGATNNDERKKILLTLYTDDTNDAIREKYNDKNKIYDFFEIYDDMVKVSNENLYLFMEIFENIKFKLRAKCDGYFSVYDNYYMEYKIENKNNHKLNVGTINSQINFIGTDKKTKENKYLLTDSSFCVEKFQDRNKKYNDYNIEQINLMYNRESKIGYQDYIFKFYIDHTFDIILTKINEDGEKVEDKKVNNVENIVKKIGVDKNIDISDNILFGKNLIWTVVSKDDENNNKVLIMLSANDTRQYIEKMKWSDAKECTYKDSNVREYLNEKFMNEYFSDSDRNRMYVTRCKYIIKENNSKIIEESYVDDKIFVLSMEEIDKYRYFLTDPIDITYIRDQRFGKGRVSMYSRRKTINHEHYQDTYKEDEKWYANPLIWINIE